MDNEWPQGGAGNTTPPQDVIVEGQTVNLSAYSDLLAIVDAARDLIVYRPVGETAVEDGLINRLAMRLNAWDDRERR